jgi:nitroreductase
MTPVDHTTVRNALALACRAPSVHNTQPWQWRLGDNSVHLYADLRRWLPATDAEGRDLVVSCGAVLHHARVALAAAGLRTTLRRRPNPDEPDHLAALTLSAGPPADADLALAAAITRRRTDRRRYSSWEIPDQMLAELAGRATEQGAVLTDISGDGTRLLAGITEAARIQEAEPAYRHETALWSGRSAGVDGIPAPNLPPAAPAGTPARRFAAGTIDQIDIDEPDGALLAVLGTASDDTLSQLRAGEALSAVMLHATVLGLATCPLSQPLEVESTRTTLRDDILLGAMSPHLVVRIGWAPTAPLPPTPRRPISEVLRSLDLGRNG